MSESRFEKGNFIVVCDTKEDWDSLCDEIYDGQSRKSYYGSYEKENPNRRTAMDIREGSFQGWCHYGYFVDHQDYTNHTFFEYSNYRASGGVGGDIKIKYNSMTKFFKVLKDTPNYDAGEIIQIASTSDWARSVDDVFQRELTLTTTSVDTYRNIYGYVVEAPENKEFFQRVYPVIVANAPVTYMTRAEAKAAREQK